MDLSRVPDPIALLEGLFAHSPVAPRELRQVTVTELARTAVPDLADMCSVFVVQADGSLHRAAAAGRAGALS